MFVGRPIKGSAQAQAQSTHARLDDPTQQPPHDHQSSPSPSLNLDPSPSPMPGGGLTSSPCTSTSLPRCSSRLAHPRRPTPTPNAHVLALHVDLAAALQQQVGAPQVPPRSRVVQRGHAVRVEAVGSVIRILRGAAQRRRSAQRRGLPSWPPDVPARCPPPEADCARRCRGSSPRAPREGGAVQPRRCAGAPRSCLPLAREAAAAHAPPQSAATPTQQQHPRTHARTQSYAPPQTGHAARPSRPGQSTRRCAGPAPPVAPCKAQRRGLQLGAEEAREGVWLGSAEGGSAPRPARALA